MPEKGIGINSEAPMTIRQRGLVLLGLGGTIFATFVYWIAVPDAYPFDRYPAGPGGALIIGAPGAAAIVGRIECSTGLPFHRIEQAWADLSGWQRFFGGTLIVVLGGGVAFAGVAAVLV
jgi:hypothetical protein